ncbi:MAG TPA: RagB/SusD family nutrient uptake outer membrane protein [Paludibacteraceae bacterium]|nr:RagB/SusD family nutrient uptake outer membrane protein [Paludibacteraceae bacterium]HOL00006.1 RagB/SusD family nutrient uptake outer membrane protein [Paludibacteraceae bacterium]HPO67147.1 RagB/SusD family nutrient uptake outer membrane protein [Paludibacteraceae bacterium]
MNKILFKILTLSFSLIFLMSCHDFLDKEILGNSTDENFYDTQYKLQAALNASYDVLQMDIFNECEWRFGEACADDVWGGDEGLASQMGQLVNFRFNTSNEWIQNRYMINYKGIHRVNQVIANAHRVKLSVNDYSSYKAIREIVGQAKFLRALYYFNLVKTYGGVPIRPETETVDKFVIPRSPAEEVYAYIEKDLREAAIMLPARYMGTDAGKASEGAAIALLMKVLMYQSTPGVKSDKWEEIVRLGEFFVEGRKMTFGDILKYDASKEDWENLRKRLWFKPRELNTLTDPYETPNTELPALQNAYSLEYKDYYGKNISYCDQFFQVGEFCKGSIFEIVFKESADGSTGDINEGTPIYDNHYSSSPQIWTTADIIQELFANDPRRAFTIGHQQYAPDGDLCQCGPGRYLSLKWYTPLKDRPQYAGDNGKNRRLIRYVEVILMYAEALNECHEGARALEQLNKVKAQANTINNSGVLYTGGGYGLMRDQIWKERRIELCFEWDRFFDLVRQKRAAEIIQTYGSKRANKRGYYFRKGVNELFPIPQSEIDISNGIVQQNPGY